MRHVHALHEEVVGADHGFAFGGRAAVDGHVLANGIVIADFGGSFFSLKFQVLRNSTDHCAGEHKVAVAHARAAQEGYAVHEAVACANHDVFVDVAEWSDFTALADNGFGVHVCHWANVAHNVVL